MIATTAKINVAIAVYIDALTGSLKMGFENSLMSKNHQINGKKKGM
jgi:hypothetical protein